MLSDPQATNRFMPVISDAAINDAAELLAVQKAAFHQEAVFYNNFAISPLVETVGEYAATFSRYTLLKAVAEGAIIGSVRAHRENSTCCITRLVVHPAWQRRGIGTLLMRAIEQRCRSAERFELFTGAGSAGNISFYTNIGYRVFKRSETTEVPMVFMEKITHGCTG